jgi:mono/diheme cytochrome c family protein
MAFLAVGAGALIVAAFVFNSFIGRANPPRMDANNEVQVAEGRNIFRQACASCHAELLQAQIESSEHLGSGMLSLPLLNASGRAWRLTDKELFVIVKSGHGAYPAKSGADVPAFESPIGDGDIAAALAYVKSTWPVEVQARQTRRSLAFWRATPH